MLATGAMTPEQLAKAFAADPHGTLTAHGNKLDGHARSAAWEAGLTPGAPAQLRCEVFIASDHAASVRLYSSFDNTLAMKGRADTLHSTLRLAGTTLTSWFIHSARFRKALDLALALQAGTRDGAAQHAEADRTPSREGRHRRAAAPTAHGSMVQGCHRDTGRTRCEVARTAGDEAPDNGGVPIGILRSPAAYRRTAPGRLAQLQTPPSVAGAVVAATCDVLPAD
jgi:hypothetical protein